MNLDDLLEKVDSRKTFLDFVKALRDDRIDEVEKEKVKKSPPYAPGPAGWENGTIEAFLDAMHAYGLSATALPEQPDWKTFALLLYAGKFYE
jgi:hypothetical protein